MKSLRFGDNVTVVFPSPINQTIVVTPPPCKSADAGPTQYDSLVINAAGKDTSPFDAVQPSPIKSPASALLDGNDDESIDLAPEEDERLDYAPNYKMSLHADHRAIILDHTTSDWNAPTLTNSKYNPSSVEFLITIWSSTRCKDWVWQVSHSTHYCLNL